MAQTLGMDGLYRARLKVAVGKETIENIRARAAEKEPQIEAAANEFDAAFKDLLEYIDAVDGDSAFSATARRFFRSILSREFIIAIVAIIAILTGDIDGQEAIAIGAATSGLAFGRGVAKNNSGNSN
tara:strand:+ start:124 stop:504 length:381 start_codon:yes stop_codon:yes gene_type:complete